MVIIWTDVWFTEDLSKKQRIWHDVSSRLISHNSAEPHNTHLSAPDISAYSLRLLNCFWFKNVLTTAKETFAPMEMAYTYLWNIPFAVLLGSVAFILTDWRRIYLSWQLHWTDAVFACMWLNICGIKIFKRKIKIRVPYFIFCVIRLFVDDEPFWGVI